MKRERIVNILTRVALLCVTMLSVSCSADMNIYQPEPRPSEESGMYITAFGMLDSNKWEIVTDGGTRLQIVALGRQLSEEDVVLHEGRVLFNYTILETGDKTTTVRLNRFYPLEVKDMELFEADETNADILAMAESNPEWKDEDFVSLLEAPIMPYEVSVGGGYININVCYSSTLSPNEELPDVELYYDVDSSREEMALLQLVGESEDEMYASDAKLRFRWFSFRITDEIRPMIASATIYTFYWCWWTEEGRPQAGVKDYVSDMGITPNTPQNTLSMQMTAEE